MARTEELEDIPESSVDQEMQNFRDAGAAKVTKVKQSDGNYTVTAYFQ